MAATLAAQRPGMEVRVYPAGVIGAARLDWALAAGWRAEVAGGVNVTDRRDWGEHEDERGWGPGGAVGVRYARRATGWWAGARAGLWSLGIDWRDPSAGLAGSTRVLVWQPTVQAGWQWRAGAWGLDIGLAFGREINVRTRGAPVGAGWIGLAVAGVSWRARVSPTRRR